MQLLFHLGKIEYENYENQYLYVILVASSQKHNLCISKFITIFEAIKFNNEMRNIFILCFLLITTSGFSQTKKSYKIGIIGFYNLENLFDTIDGPNNDAEFLPNGANHYTGEVYIDKLGKLSDVLSQIGTDASPDGLSLFGVAEVENKNVLVDLIATEKLKDRHYEIVHYDSPDERGIDVALIYNPKYLTVTASENLFVDLSTPKEPVGHKTRDVLFVTGKYDGEPIYIFVNHWPSRRGGEEASAPGRKKAAKVCRDKMNEIQRKDPNAKIVVMGDLNDDPTNESVAKIIGATGDIENLRKGQMYNPWTELFEKGIGTLAYNDAWSLFDQIIISEPFISKKQKGFFYREADIFNKPFMSQQSGRYKGYPKRTYDFSNYAGGYSDHFPTYIILYKEIVK